MTPTNGIFRRSRSLLLPAWAACTAWLAASAAAAQNPQGPLTDVRLEAVAREVHELREAAEALLAPLPPEERARVEARLLELAEETRAPEATTAAPAPPERPAPVPPVQPPPSNRPTPAACGGLAAFDRDADGIVSAADRAWRHLYLWQDDGDAVPEEDEVGSLFDHGVRALDTSRRTYTTATGFVGDLEIGEGVTLEVPARKRGADFERGELVVDNDGLRRAGEPTVRGANGQELAGYQPLRRDSRLVSSDGSELALPCN
jgi:hypothetical protein